MDLGEKIYSMEVREDDVWVVTFPKAGTTWMQNIVSQLCQLESKSPMDNFHFIDVKCIVPNFNKLAEKVIMEKMSIGEVSVMEAIKNMEISETKKKGWMDFDKCVAAESPRFIKSNLPLCLLPPEITTEM